MTSQKHNKDTKADKPTTKPPDPTDSPLFFYTASAIHGEFSQWHPSPFHISASQITSLIAQPVPSHHIDNAGNVTFNCAEQFMMYCKAGRFQDQKTQGRILSSTRPKDQKALGRRTPGFSDASWDEVKSAVVTARNEAKFGQDEALRRRLLDTGDRLLVETAARDRIWGIGYSSRDAMKFRELWGENRLGMALMAARERLRKKEQEEAAGQGQWKGQEDTDMGEEEGAE